MLGWSQPIHDSVTNLKTERFSTFMIHPQQPVPNSDDPKSHL